MSRCDGCGFREIGCHYTQTTWGGVVCAAGFPLIKQRALDILDAEPPKKWASGLSEDEADTWHTGIPTEEGLYAVYYYADDEYEYGFAVWNGDFWEEHFSYDSIGCMVIAWQKIEPYKENI